MEESGRLYIYFEKRSILRKPKAVFIWDLVSNENIPPGAKQLMSIDTLEEVLLAYAVLFKTHLIPGLTEKASCKGQKTLQVIGLTASLM